MANSDLATFSNQAYTPDRLVAHNSDDLLQKQITLISGQNLTRGSVLGKISIGAATAAAKSGGNTGNGTCVMDATTPVLPNAQVGIYTVRNIIAGTNTGTFIVTGPDGRVVGEPIIPAGAGGSITFSNQIKFAITDGATDFVAGDGFDITVAAGSGKYTLAVSTAIDGSATPDAILADDCNASGGDTVGLAYINGTFNANSLTFGSGVTVANSIDGLRQRGINIVNATAA